MSPDLDMRELAIRALHEQGDEVSPMDSVRSLIDHLAHRNRGKAGVKGTIHLGVRRATGRRPRLMIVEGKKRKSIEIDFIEGVELLDHPHAKIELQIYKDSKHKRAYGKVDWRLLPIEDMLQIFLEDYGTQNMKRALEMAEHVKQLNEVLAGNLLGDLDIKVGDEYAAYRMSQQIKSQSPDALKKVMVSFTTSCMHLQTFNQALIYYCKKTKIARIEFDMPKGYVEEVEYLNWNDWIRILLAAKGLIWDPAGGETGDGGWKKEWRVDASGRLRLRLVLAPPDQRKRLQMMIRFLLIYFYTGTRYSQILKLRWKETATEPWINFAEGKIVRDSIKRTITNKRRETSVLLTVLLRMLKKWHAADVAAGLDKFVIHQPGLKKPYLDVDDTIKLIAVRAGLPHFTSHMSKHSGVTAPANKGFLPQEIAALFSTTAEVLQKTYTHLDEYFQREAVAAADARGLDKMSAFAPTSTAGRLRADRAPASV